ncbi:MAG: permease [Deltaproteobacteria bacterium]|nr:MAG: permease [Deltaproteobacteria bacterium]
MIVALVLLSAFLHALWNALLRLEESKDRSLVVAVMVATVFAAGVAGVRWGAGEVPFASVEGVGFTLLAGLCEAVYFVTLARAMELGKLGVVYTVSRGGAVLAVWPLSIALFGEVATLPAMAGSGAVRGAVAWAAECVMSLAAYQLTYKAALREGTNPSACFAQSLGMSATLSLVRLRGGGRAALRPLVRRRWKRLLVMGVVCSGSFLILMEALANGGSAFVLTLRNTSVLFAAGMAWWIGEQPGRSELAGAALVAAGAVLIAW